MMSNFGASDFQDNFSLDEAGEAEPVDEKIGPSRLASSRYNVPQTLSIDEPAPSPINGSAYGAEYFYDFGRQTFQNNPGGITNAAIPGASWARPLAGDDYDYDEIEYPEPPINARPSEEYEELEYPEWEYPKSPLKTSSHAGRDTLPPLSASTYGYFLEPGQLTASLTPTLPSRESLSAMVKPDSNHKNSKRARDSLGTAGPVNFKSLRLTSSPTSSGLGTPYGEYPQTSDLQIETKSTIPINDFELAQQLESQERVLENEKTLKQQHDDFEYARRLQVEMNRDTQSITNNQAAEVSPESFNFARFSNAGGPSNRAGSSAWLGEFPVPPYPKTSAKRAPDYRPIQQQPIVIDSESDTEHPYRRVQQRTNPTTGRLHQDNMIPRPQSSSSQSVIDLTNSSPDNATFPSMPGGWRTPDMSAPVYHDSSVLGYSNPYGSNYCGPIPYTNSYISQHVPGPSMGQTLYNQTSRIATGIVQGLKTSYKALVGDTNVSLGQSSAYDPFSAHSHNNLQASQSMNRPPSPDYNSDEHRDPRSAEQLRNLVDNIQSGEELEAEVRMATPPDLVPEAALYEHKKIALKWMIKQEHSNRGGILADAMGLGKTVETISLLVSARPMNPDVKTNLIVAPLAVLNQWATEIETKIKEGRRLRTYVYRNQKAMNWNRLQQFDVVIVSYGTVASEYKRKSLSGADCSHLVLFHSDANFFRIILDEAHTIKNRKTITSKGCIDLQGLYRWCLTGTPMQNSVAEVYPMLAFLRIGPYNNWLKFSKEIAGMMKSRDLQSNNTALRKVQVIFKSILLRRTKASTIDGKPILNLPERETKTLYATFEPDQFEFYDAVEKKTQAKYNKYLKAGDVNNHISAVIVLLLRLRQVTCHPHLIRDLREESIAGVPASELLKIAQENLDPTAITRLLREIAEGDLIPCPMCSTEPMTRLFTPCGHGACSSCYLQYTENMENRDEKPMAECHICSGEVDLRMITDMTSFKIAHLPGFTQDDDSSEDEVEEDTSNGESSEEDDTDLDGFVVNDASEEDVDSSESSNLSFDKGHKRVKEIVWSRPDRENESPPTNKSLDGFSKLKFSSSAKTSSMGRDDESVYSKKRVDVQKSKPLKKVRTRKTLSVLQREANRSAKNKKKYMDRLEKTYVPSAKIDKCMETLSDIMNNKGDDKVLVFSQFTTMLDLLEVPLARNGWEYGRYDGSMLGSSRTAALEEFRNKPNRRILLLSLKAGNVGINLTVANHVILFDPFWNPYVEEQAIDRAHRIGQRKKVCVHRIIVRDTVEDRILQIQEKKRDEVDTALNEGGKLINSLNTNDFAYLFGLGPR